MHDETVRHYRQRAIEARNLPIEQETYSTPEPLISEDTRDFLRAFLKDRAAEAAADIADH